MAKRNNEPPSGADKAKVRVFFAELEGNNESVQEALKTMVSAMNRPVRVISEHRPEGKQSALLQKAEIEEVEEITDETDETPVSDEDSSSSNGRKPRGTGKKIDRNAGLALVPDLDFRPSGKASFRDVVGKKTPENDLETVLVAVHYMQHTMAVPKIGPSHVMTAFKEAGKAIPADLKQTIRNIKKQRMWLNFSDIEDIRTTTQGDNFVEHDMTGDNA